MSKTSGYTIVHNAVKGDYCIVECIRSLIPCCDEVVVGEAASDDGTAELLRDTFATEPKVRIVAQPWTQPVRDIRWFVNWINQTRTLLKHENQLMLDADEVLDERAYPIIQDAARTGKALWFERINYIKDCRTVIGHGETCGHLVVRFGPTAMWMPSDEPYESPDQEPEIRKVATFIDPPPILHHFGFLRRNEAMFEKTRVNLTGFFGDLDQRLVQAEAEGKHWQHYAKHKLPYLTYNGPQPAHCMEWLRERGAL